MANFMQVGRPKMHKPNHHQEVFFVKRRGTNEMQMAKTADIPSYEIPQQQKYFTEEHHQRQSKHSLNHSQIPEPSTVAYINPAFRTSLPYLLDQG